MGTVVLPPGQAASVAGYGDPHTTKLYDRRWQKVTRGEVERIRYEKKRTVPGASEEA